MANITVNLKVWRQAGPKEKGAFRTYTVETDTDTSFLETLDILNEQWQTMKSLLRSTTIAARVYAVCARCI